MNTKHFKLLGCAALSLLCALVSHAQSVSSTPVGYVTLTINGGGFTSLSNPLEQAVVYSGTASAVNGAVISTSFTMTDSEFATQDPNGDYTHYVQTSDGIILTITANTASSITVASDVSSILSADDQIVVKKFSTVGDLLSDDNSIGLTSTTSVTTSDVLYVMSGDGTGAYSIYYYQTDPSPSTVNFFGGSGWRSSTDNSTDMSGVVLGPDDGIFVKRSASTDVSFVVTGTVNAVDHRRDLPSGYTLVSYPFPVATTLDNSGIYSSSNGYVSTTSATTSDVVYLINLDGSFTIYYYQTDPSPSTVNFFGGSGWRLTTDNSTDVGSTEIPAGSSLIIFHRGSGLAWSDSTPYTLN